MSRLFLCHYVGFVLATLALHAPSPAQQPAFPKTANSDQTPSTQRDTVERSVDLWYGVLKTPNRELRFVLELNTEHDSSSGSMRSLDEGNQIFELTHVDSKHGKLTFSLPATEAAYASTLKNSETRSTGTWTQRGQQLPLSFEKVAKIPKRNIKAMFTGTLNAIVQRIEVSIVELETGQLYFNSVSQNAGGFIATKEISKDGVITFRVPAVQGVFRGRYQSEQKNKLQGQWTQGPVSLDLDLSKQVATTERFEPRQSQKARRPQTPKPPFPYKIERVKIATPERGVTLAGTLTIPENRVRAAVVLVTGSGPQDRDESIFNHKPFHVIADHFAQHGIATLRYDDRGVAESSGDFSAATSLDLANDAEAAFNFLITRDELNNANIGICGHSEGGLLAPLIAARNDSVAFIILMAAPGVDGQQIILSQGPLLMRAQGIPEPDITKQNKIQEAVLSIIRNNQQNDEELISVKLRQALGSDEPEIAQTIQTLQASVKQQATPWLRTFLSLDPKVALKKLKCPVLAINGTKDLQVDAVLNLPVIRDTLQNAGNRHLEINVYPGLNHLFQRCQTGLPSEYGTIEETFNLVPLHRMTKWILEQTTQSH